MKPATVAGAGDGQAPWRPHIGYDVRPQVAEQVRSVGAQWLGSGGQVGHT